MKDEKKFTIPEAKIITFLSEDVILTSVIDEYDEDDPISH